ncbi:hypothetical protein PVL29_019554 [Vitis rotundifolia]|uniref:Pentatricopeptide repeat-containing protein n=1 Tax=Vitis rotundifolia TaxID=103349 RepID=A0AA39DE11_VITRO|nr:hypothetical protein PVL29_019554 [Vitis rotundifolia]
MFPKVLTTNNPSFVPMALSSSSSSLASTLPHDFNPQKLSFLSTLQTCKSIQGLKQIHASSIKTMPSPDTQLTISTRLSALCAQSLPIDPRYALPLLAQLRTPNLPLYNAIIRGLATSNNDSIEGLVVYKQMLSKGIVPDNYTIPFVLKACAESRAVREGEEVHGQAIKMGLASDVYVSNTLMRMYAVCDVIRSARKVFDSSPQRDLVSWTTMIQGYVKMGFAREGVGLFFEMCGENLQADGMTLVIVLSACARLGDLRLGRKLHRYVIRNSNVNLDVFVGNALVDMYLKCGDANFARKVFQEMPIKNVVSWNSMISGLAQKGEFKESLYMFRKMQRLGVKPDDVTLVAVLNSCANLGVLELGKWVHAYLDRNQIRADGFIGNALVDMYAKCGSIDQACWVFQAMNRKDVYSYTAMIVGLAMHGQGGKALDLFSEMPKMGIEPDEVTFVGVLTACSHVGLVEEGRKYFEDMSTIYNLRPQLEHYGCMVDLLGRAGLINEAEEFIRNMPIEPDAFVLGALLGACKIHGKVELGESVMKKIEKIEPRKDGAYVLMSNIYSSANRWRDSLKLRKAMKERNLEKTPGCSSIELDGVIHEFQKGDKSHPKTKEIYKLLDGSRAI